jgi:hypothetical protein
MVQVLQSTWVSYDLESNMETSAVIDRNKSKHTLEGAPEMSVLQ